MFSIEKQNTHTHNKNDDDDIELCKEDTSEIPSY